MRHHLLGIGLASLITTAVTVAQPPDGFVALFDGKSLDGWSLQNGKPETFGVKEGVLRLEGTSGWLRTDRQYSDLQLKVEFRFLTDNADSGIFVRTVGDATFIRGWPRNSYQVQTRDITTNKTTKPILIGNVYRHANDPGEVAFDEAAAFQAARKTSEWQSFDIEVRGDRLSVSLNGVPVTRTVSLVNPTGHLGIQIEAGVVEYRSILIKELR